MQQTPTDRLYQQGVPHDPGQIVRGVRIDDTTSRVTKDVDWEQSIATDKDTGYATASATSHYHYLKLSHLLLCDRIVVDARNVPEPLQQVARQFARQNTKELEAWGKYMQTTGGGGRICPEQREYYQLLFTRRDVLPVLLGIQTINLAADTSYEDFYKNADPVFRKLADGFAAENQHTYHTTRDNFRDVIQPLSAGERMQLLQHVAQHVDLCQLIMEQRDDDVFEPLNAEAATSTARAGRRIKQFYDEIGLTDGIL